MRSLHYSVGRQKVTAEQKLYHFRNVLRAYAWKNAITITLMAAGFIITWIVIIVSAVLND